MAKKQGQSGPRVYKVRLKNGKTVRVAIIRKPKTQGAENAES